MNRYDVLGGSATQQQKAIAVTAAVTALAGVGATVYLAAKAKWVAAAVTFLVGAPVAVATAAVLAGVLTQPDDERQAPAKIPGRPG